jgi:hypothetical protein
VPFHQGVEQLVFVVVQCLPLAQDLRERLGLVQQPGVHGPDQLVLADEVQLQRQDAE